MFPMPDGPDKVMCPRPAPSGAINSAERCTLDKQNLPPSGNRDLCAKTEPHANSRTLA